MASNAAIVDHLINLEYTTPEIDIEVKNMVIEQVSGLGADAIANPKKYKGFMGVSLPNLFYKPSTMEEYIKYSSELFSEFRILLIDMPDVHNLQVFKGLTSEESRQRVLNRSEELKRSYMRIAKKHNFSNVSVIRVKDFEADSLYQSILGHVKSSVKLDHELETDLYTLMREFIGGKLQSFFQESQADDTKRADTKKRLLSYLIEELASIIYMTEVGYTIELDPTKELSLKEALYENLKYKDLVRVLNLGERGHIYVHPSGVVKKYRNTFEPI